MGVAILGVQFATDVTGRVILLGNVLRVTVEGEEVSESAVVEALVVAMRAQSATSATGLVISLANVVKKTIVVSRHWFGPGAQTIKLPHQHAANILSVFTSFDAD